MLTKNECYANDIMLISTPVRSVLFHSLTIMGHVEYYVQFFFFHFIYLFVIVPLVFLNAFSKVQKWVCFLKLLKNPEYFLSIVYTWQGGVVYGPRDFPHLPHTHKYIKTHTEVKMPAVKWKSQEWVKVCCYSWCQSYVSLTLFFQDLLAQKFSVLKHGLCLNSPFCFCVLVLPGHVIITGIYINIFQTLKLLFHLTALHGTVN